MQRQIESTRYRPNGRWVARIGLIGVCTAALLGLLCPTAQAIESGTSATGVRYVSGGVGQEEALTLRENRAAYTLWLVTATARGSAWLSDVQVRIRQRDTGAVVLEHRLDGPWLMADLPAGQYRIEAIWEDSETGVRDVQLAEVTIARDPSAHEPKRLTLFFATGDRTRDRRTAP